MFYPRDDAEVRQMVTVLAKKNKVPLASDSLPTIKADRFLSGSDIESVVLAAKRQVLSTGRTEVTSDDIEAAFREFIPSAQGLEKEMQELAAVLECTQLCFLAATISVTRSLQPTAAAIQERFVGLKQLPGRE